MCDCCKEKREDGLRDLHASIMLPAKCHKATVICLLSLHTFRTTHSSHCHLSVCVCVYVCVGRVCVPAWLIVANVVAAYPLQSANIWAPNSPNWHPAHSTISKFPHSVSNFVPHIHPPLPAPNSFRFRLSTHPCLSCLLLLLLISATFTWLT